MPELAHTCYRILEIERSLVFYRALGFEELRRMSIRAANPGRASGPPGDGDCSASLRESPIEAINVFVGLPGDGPRLELTFNLGREEPYEIGTGYGHIAVRVGDLDATLAGLAEQGIRPEKPPYQVRAGGSRLCFVRDPDGYRIELIGSS